MNVLIMGIQSVGQQKRVIYHWKTRLLKGYPYTESATTGAEDNFISLFASFAL